jgi:hypothetical protein
MVSLNEVVWRLGPKSAQLISAVLHKSKRYAVLDLREDDAKQFYRLLGELDELIRKTPERMVQVEVLSAEERKAD